MGFEVSDIDILEFKSGEEGSKPYIDFLYVTYLKSLRYGNPWFEDIEASVYYKIHHQILENLLLRPHAVLRIAVLPDDHDVAIGWSLSEGPLLHYVFVKAKIEARKLGIATHLVPPGITTVTHLTKAGRIIAKKKKWKFNPYAEPINYG